MGHATTHLFVEVVVASIILFTVFLILIPVSDPLHGWSEDRVTTTSPPSVSHTRREVDSPWRTGCSSGTVWVESSGHCERLAPLPQAVEELFLDSSTSPCVNFYEYACGNYGEESERDAVFWHLAQKSEQQTEDLLTRIAVQDYNPDHPSQLSSFYHSCLNQKSQPYDVSLLSPEKSLGASLYQKIQQLKDRNELVRVMGELSLYGVRLPFRVSREPHPLQPEKRVITLIQGSGVPAESVEQIEGTLQNYESNNREFVLWISDMEKQIQKLCTPIPAQSLSHYVSSGQATEDLSPLKTFFLDSLVETATEGVWSQGEPLWLLRRGFFEAFPELLKEGSLQHWKSYLTYQLLRSLRGELQSAPHPEEKAHSLTHGESQESQLPWLRVERTSLDDEQKQALQSMEQGSEARCRLLTRIYLAPLLDLYFIKSLPRSRSLLALDTELQQSLLQLAGSNEELSAAGKQELLQWLSATESMLGSPPENQMYSQLEKLSPTSSLEDNILYIHVSRQRALLSSPHLRAVDWYYKHHSTQNLRTPNAYYVPSLNGVLLHASLLQQPLYSEEMSRVAQYARLGVILAHERAHALDRTSINLGPLFSSKRDQVLFEEALACVGLLYQQETTSLLGNSRVRANTMNEDIADTLGFHAAFAASQPENVEEKRTFYLAYAQTLCRRLSLDEKIEFSVLRQHSLPEVRVNMAVMSHSNFSETWGCADRSMAARKFASLQQCRLFK